MIKMTIEGFITVYFVLMIAIITFSWFFYLIRSKRTPPLLFPTKVHQCEYCTSVYMERASVKMPRCPICGSFNP